MTQTASPSAEDPAEDSAAIRRRLMQAGLREFAQFGLKGARLEGIAAAAGCAKRMIYYYFGDKEGLYLAVLNEAYSAIRDAEAQLELDEMDPVAALHRLARHSFAYHDAHPDFTRLVLVENLQDGAMMQRLGHDAVRLRAAALEPMARILERGVRAGQFRAGLLPEDVHYLISALSAYRIDHAGTWKSLLGVDLLSRAVKARHLEMFLATLDAYVGLAR